MANYYGKGRSNHFKVKDIERFKEIAGHYELEVQDSSSVSGALVVFSTSDNGSMAQEIMCDDIEEVIESLNALGINIIDGGDIVTLPPFENIIGNELQVDEVFIWQEVGNESKRYNSGYSFAVNSTGECLSVNIDQIYEQIKKHWNIESSLAQY